MKTYELLIYLQNKKQIIPLNISIVSWDACVAPKWVKMG